MHSSIRSYEERGPWGDRSYHGNCSGHLIKDLLETYQPKTFVDPAEGSGTSRQVAEELGIPYRGLDLKTGFDLLTDNLLKSIGRPVELAFFHPPYHNAVIYSGNVWGRSAHPNDLSRCETYREFIQKLKTACRNTWEAVQLGGRLAILIGDIRRNGIYYSPQSRIQQFGLHQLESILVKQQHNVRSSACRYTGQFIPIMHEYVLIFRKTRERKQP